MGFSFPVYPITKPETWQMKTADACRVFRHLIFQIRKPNKNAPDKPIPVPTDSPSSQPSPTIRPTPKQKSGNGLDSVPAAVCPNSPSIPVTISSGCSSSTAMPPAAASTNPVNRRMSFAAVPSSSGMPDWNSANNQQGERFSAAVEALFRQEAEYFRNMGLAAQRRLHGLWDRRPIWRLIIVCPR